MAAAGAEVAAPGAPGSGGLPQFDIGLWPGQVVWVLLIFAALYVLFARVFVPRIAGAIDAREDKIADDIGEARRLRDAAMEERATAQADLAKARARALALAAAAQSDAKARAAARQAEEDARHAEVLAAAEARIAEARAEAMRHVGAIARDAAEAIVARLTGTKASATELDAALASPASA